MSQEILTMLRDRAAFKPKPPEYELALAHVQLGEVGFNDAIEERVLHIMRASEGSFALIVAPAGCGKSSLLAWSASEVSGRERDRKVVPIHVPVSHHSAPIEPDSIVRGVAEGIAIRLGPQLRRRDREAIEKALAITIAARRNPPRLRAGISAPLLHGLTAEVAAELGGDLTTVVRQGGWQGGAHAGLVSLGRIAHARHARLVVIIDDTDIWSAGDDGMASSASAFFASMRSLIDCSEVTMLVAVQSHWADAAAEGDTPTTTTARLQFRELAERASRVLHIPDPRDDIQARRLVEAILEKRMEITLDPPAPEGGWRPLAFTSQAVALLAQRCVERNLRQALTDLRDTFDHHDVLPAQIDAEHIAEAIA